jgi:hypothetical protein
MNDEQSDRLKQLIDESKKLIEELTDLLKKADVTADDLTNVEPPTKDEDADDKPTE